MYDVQFSRHAPNLPLRELLDELEDIASIRGSINQGVVTIDRQ